MNGSSKKRIRAFAVMALCAIMVLGASQTALATSAIDREATGSLTIIPKYGDLIVRRGTFDIYLVAVLEDTPNTLEYTLEGNFARAANEGLDISSVKTAAQLQSAADILIDYISAGDRIVTLNIANGDTISNLELGAYLVVQTAATGYYVAADPFLVFVPSVDTETDEWVYDITANPKLGYDAPTTTRPPTTTTPTTTTTTTTIERVATPQVSTSTPGYEIDIGDGDTPLAGIDGGEEVDIPDGDVPLSAPQTGMLQWPIPVLSILGIGFITSGTVIGRDKKKRED